MGKKKAPNYSITDIRLEDCLPIRQRVLGPTLTQDECRVPHDETACHLGGYLNSDLIACVSLFRLDADTVQLRKFAVLPEFQGHGLGSLIIQSTFERCREQGFTLMTLDARVTATRFYDKHGMTPVGDIFFKGTIKHIRMIKPL